ncbi:MAG: hypothetical protein ACR2G6_02830 [Gemmatimonadaceae bacterium]
MNFSLGNSRLAVAHMLAATVLLGCSSDDNGTGPVVVPPGAADISADITTNRTFKAETTYTLTNFVHVVSGATLTIEPGTVIKGRTGSALFILRGARINADGRVDAPIVFTSDQPVGSRKPGDWGGLILIGNGIINRAGTIDLEGTGTPASNPVVNYGGGSDNADNSGVLRYVRVEFAGFGVAPNQELNSFTFAAVGSGTQVDHIQSLAGLDDSFEWFGGAFDARYLVSYESGDDHFDASEGYVGRSQFLIAFQSTRLTPRAGSGDISSDPQGFENDGCGSASGSGCTLGYNSTPLNIPLFANFTLVGTGPNAQIAATSGGIGMMLRRGTGGYYVNGIVARWPRAAISLRDQVTLDRATAGDLQIRNLFLAENGETFQSQGTGTGAAIQGSLDVVANNIEVAGSGVTSASLFTALPAAPATAASFDWSLVAGAAPATGGMTTFTGALATKAGGFVTGTAYRGAAGATGEKWWQGWTAYAQN